jgi:hypothetical protein
MNLLTQLSGIFNRLGIGEIKDNTLDNLVLSYDENLKGGAHAVKSDDTSRPRNRFSRARIIDLNKKK